MARNKKGEAQEDYLVYDRGTYRRNAGRVYALLQKITFPGLLIGLFQVALMNTGMINFDAMPRGVFYAAMAVMFIYILPSIFILPTSWFLSSGKTRLLKESYVEVHRRRELIYHKAARVTMGEPEMQRIRVRNIRKVTKTKRNFVIEGDVQNLEAGTFDRELKLPIAFTDMEKVEALG